MHILFYALAFYALALGRPPVITTHHPLERPPVQVQQCLCAYARDDI